MDPQNTGSFGAAIGGSDALKASMDRRGIDASLLDNISPAAPTGPSEVSPALPGEATASQVTGAAPAAPTGGATPTRSGEMEIALKALAGTVKTENKIAEAVLGLR